MKDLTFIAEGNPDFFKGGLINLTKRRQASDFFLTQCSKNPRVKTCMAVWQNSFFFFGGGGCLLAI